MATIEKLAIPDFDYLSDFGCKTEILGGLNLTDVAIVGPITNDGELGIIAAQLNTPTG